ncbi:hypothetical protein CEXT_766771 [Caerostris extrusa]|uniref:Uncharacterized protein n=1 Tax=Caerostris extrusa TaxID=172846 RepID=A0AAV4WFV5_CAEEX|nr:hypothetical protein CEXT_766771 [Caerostris extrusa]
MALDFYICPTITPNYGSTTLFTSTFGKQSHPAECPLVHSNDLLDSDIPNSEDLQMTARIHCFRPRKFVRMTVAQQRASLTNGITGNCHF